jgi:tRNA threonylcarbamoyladenosine biosynthesis protein TsaB
MADELTLALETAIGSGSAALMKGSGTLVSTRGTDSKPGRAEELLTVVRSLLDSAGTDTSDLTRVVVSTGPGSYSGIRIGMATALGLKDALGIDCIGVQLLDAMAHCVESSQAKVVVAVPVGRKDIAWQEFENASAVSGPLLGPEQNFRNALLGMNHFTLHLAGGLGTRLGSLEVPMITIDSEITLAEIVGRYATAHPEHSSLSPVYLHNQSHTHPQPRT